MICVRLKIATIFLKITINLHHLNPLAMKTKMIIYLLSMGTIGLLTTLPCLGQTSEKYNLSELARNKKLEPFNREITPFSENDKEGIRFSKNSNDGIAWLKGVDFSNGIIEVDIRGKDIFQQSFVGVAFHGSDNNTLDAVYFRPFNFNSTDQIRKIHAVQYISHPDNTWAVLREKQNGKFEKAVMPAPNGNDWFHAKIVVHYPHVSVYINGNTSPCLEIDKLNNLTSGKIGLWVGNGSDGDFANLQIINEN
jgi:hypothetical protein